MLPENVSEGYQGTKLVGMPSVKSGNFLGLGQLKNRYFMNRDGEISFTQVPKPTPVNIGHIIYLNG